MVGFDFIYHKENDLLKRKQKIGVDASIYRITTI